MALQLYNTLYVEESDRDLLIESRSNQPIPLDRRNLIYITIENFFKEIGKKQPGLHMIQHDLIPLTRGLGSSAACIVSGLAAANEISRAGLSRDELLQMAARLEGHPDNAAPAFLGGIVAGAMDNGRLFCCKLDTPKLSDLAFAVMIPDFPLPTEQARKVLPNSYGREDAVFNASRAALLTAALTSGRFELLKTAMQDVIHQPYRSKIIPGMNGIFAECLNKGALGVFLSGAGPTVIAVVRRGHLARFVPKLPSEWSFQFIEPDDAGVQIERID
jgi:homoserine kinase